MLRRWLLAIVCLVAALLLPGCGTPPNKEMDQAQGAIDAARAAGADRYATTEYSAATEALKNANTAVSERDYRLALNHALDSREHAQNAARDAADAKAHVRAEVDRAVGDLTALVARGRAQLAAATRARVPRPRLEQPAHDLTAAESALQEAGEAAAAADYLGAREQLSGIQERVAAAIAAVDAASAAQPRPRRRNQ